MGNLVLYIPATTERVLDARYGDKWRKRARARAGEAILDLALEGAPPELPDSTVKTPPPRSRADRHAARDRGKRVLDGMPRLPGEDDALGTVLADHFGPPTVE